MLPKPLLTCSKAFLPHMIMLTSSMSQILPKTGPSYRAPKFIGSKRHSPNYSNLAFMILLYVAKNLKGLLRFLKY